MEKYRKLGPRVVFQSPKRQAELWEVEEKNHCICTVLHLLQHVFLNCLLHLFFHALIQHIFGSGYCDKGTKDGALPHTVPVPGGCGISAASPEAVHHVS